MANNNMSIKGKLFVSLTRGLSTISPILCSKVAYRLMFGKKLDLDNPKTFNEKLMWLKLNTYNKNDLVTKCIDKYKVREYIKDIGCSELLNDLYYVYDNADEIDWSVLPEKYVLKCNHGCGCNIIVNDKNELDVEDAKNKLNHWIKYDFWKTDAEINYRYIDKKIICEKFIESNDGVLPNDYKIYCFNGKAKLILVCTERITDLKLSFYDCDWKALDIGVDNNPPQIKKPKNLKQMLKYAEKLAGDFPFVRVDFYDVDGKIIFGEMTFTPAACMAKYYSDKGNKLLGDMLELPKKK